ncbi:MAG TPA: YceI family protein [Actinomycetota bacterium]|jgi:polyisoprenoid-binding protein YceI
MATSAAELGTKHFPAPGRWVVDKSHSSLDFVAKHLMVTKVRGTFGEFSGTITIGDTPEASSAEAVIQAASLTTGDEKRDGHLHSPDFLDVENHPEITFKTTKVESRSPGEGTVTGDLTINGITKPVTLHATFEGLAQDPWGGERAAFAASTEINREDWRMTWNQALETGGVLVSKKVRLEIDVQAVRQ